MNFESLSKWKGFSPRWSVPTKLRNTTEETRNTSSILIVLDTQREVDIGIGPHFSKTVLKNKELLVSQAALDFLKTDVG